MQADRVFVRRKFTTKLTYQFGSDQLTYTLRDRTGEVQFSVRYDSIDVLAPYQLTLKDKTAYLIPFFIGMGLLVAAGLLRTGTYATLIGFSGLGILLLGSALGPIGLLSVKNTMFKMNPPPTSVNLRALRVIAGRDHDLIVGEIKARWRDQLRRTFLPLNPDNNPKGEKAKFDWLLQIGVITPEEHEAALNELSQDAGAGDQAVKTVLLN